MKRNIPKVGKVRPRLSEEARTMDKLIRYTILAIVAGVILAVNAYHADYKLLVAQVGTIALVAMWGIKYSSSLVEKKGSRLASLARTILKNPAIWFLGVCVLSFLLSPHKLASGQELYKVGTWVVFGIIVGSRLGLRPRSNNTEYSSSERAKRVSREVNSIINVWLACAAIIAMYGILQFFGIDFMKFKLPGDRIVSTFGNATLLAGFLAMTVPIALTLTLSPKERGKGEGVRKFAYGALVFVLLACLVLTKSRGGLIAAMIGCGIVMIQMRKTLWKRLLGLILCGIVLLLIPQVRHLVLEVVLRRTARLYLWIDALQMVRTHPIFGTGIGTFGLYFPQFVTRGVLEVHPIEWEFVNHAHCEYLEILIEMGVIGLVAFLAVVGSCILRARRFSTHCQIYSSSSVEKINLTARSNNNGIALGLFPAFITILAHNIVGVDLRYTSTGMFFWMIAGVLSCRKR